MNSKHRAVLHALFAHPASAKISPRAGESVIEELGGKAEQRNWERIGFRLNNHFAESNHPPQMIHPDEVHRISKLIKDAGACPTQRYPLNCRPQALLIAA